MDSSGSELFWEGPDITAAVLAAVVVAVGAVVVVVVVVVGDVDVDVDIDADIGVEVEVEVDAERGSDIRCLESLRACFEVDCVDSSPENDLNMEEPRWCLCLRCF